MREAYSHEASSAGFWPGNDDFPEAAFYSYAYPEPAGFRDHPVTRGAYYDTTLREFILPYDTVRGGEDPDALLLDFLSTTYAAAAEADGWRRAHSIATSAFPGRFANFTPLTKAKPRRHLFTLANPTGARVETSGKYRGFILFEARVYFDPVRGRPH